MKTKLLLFSLIMLAIGGSLSAQQTVLVQISSGVLTLNVELYQSFKVVLNQNVTSVVLSNVNAIPPNKTISITFTQDGTGGRTIAWGSVVNSPCTPTTGANSTTVCQIQYDSFSNSWNGVSGGSGSGGGVVGGTFGGSPSSGYTFTSTQITTAPFSGNLLIGAATNPTDTNTYTAGSGWTLALGSVAGTTLGVEYQTAAAASSYTAAFTQSTSQVWSSTIVAFTATNGALVQAKSAAGVASLAYTSNNTAGNLLVAHFHINTGGSGVPTSVTDTRGNTWVMAGKSGKEGDNGKGGGNGSLQQVWYAANCAAGANTVTANGVTAGSFELSVEEYSGAATSSPLVDYNYQTTTNVAGTSITGATTNNQYTINAVNNVTGVIDATSRDSGVVFRTATNNLAGKGGLLYFKDGFYPGQTSLQESVAGQTNWYVWGIAAPLGVGKQVGWHIVCESATQPLYVSVAQGGCIHQVMPSAFSGPAPSGAQLSGFWQRPNASVGATANNQVYLVNGVCRIPDNQSTPVDCVDLFTTSYSSHVGIIADTNIAAIDQVCSGLTPATSNIVGFRTNQASTDEAYFENTWVIGYNTPYSSLTNHPVSINAHAACNQNAGSFNVGTTDYGGIFIHYQDIHNIAGMIFGGALGTRFDCLNCNVENATTGSFARTTGATEITPGNSTGTVTVFTAAANGVGYTPGSFFQSGHGANFKVNESMRLLQPGLITSNFTSAATTGTTKQTLATYTFPYNNSAQVNAGPFQNNGGAVFEIVAWGITAATANSKTFEIDFGGTAIATITTSVNAGFVRCKARIIVSSVANTQAIGGECDDFSTVRTGANGTPGITGSAAIVVNIAATTATASGDFTFKGMTIEYLGGN